MTIEDKDRKWLADLEEELYQNKLHEAQAAAAHARKQYGFRISYEPTRELTENEWWFICMLIENNQLMTSMFSSSMFGGLGMSIYEHEQFPGTGPEYLGCIEEKALPAAVMLEKDLANKRRKMTSTGWNLFSQYTHSDRNREWLKKYGLSEPKDQYHYDY